MEVSEELLINPEKIKNHLKTRVYGRKIFYHNVIDSTNLEALRLVNDSKAGHGDLIISDTQSAGRGQQGHIWSSPAGGLYMTVVSASKADKSSTLITLVSGIACVEALKSITGIDTNLKWVNDIIVNKQKLVGILTETVTRGEISNHVTGIGINANLKLDNVSKSKFPPVSLIELTGNPVDINLLAAEVCNYFEEYFNLLQNNTQAILHKWLEYANITGLQVNFISDDVQLSGHIEGIDQFGRLIVNVSGKIYKLTSTKNTEIIYP